MLWRLAGPQPTALVQLARFDAHRQGHREQRPGPSRRAVPSGRRPGRPSRAGAWLEQWLQARGIAYTSLRQDLALTGQSLEAVLGRKLLAVQPGPLLAASVTGLVARAVAGAAVPAAALGLAAVCVADRGLVPGPTSRPAASPPPGAGSSAAPWPPTSTWSPWRWPGRPPRPRPCRTPPASAPDGRWPCCGTRCGGPGCPVRTPGTPSPTSDARIGVPELRDLATLVRLVGRDGARIRQTLTARAAAMRRRELADAEGEAGQKDQSMRLAQILIGFGFMVFLTYPAVVNVLAI